MLKVRLEQMDKLQPGLARLELNAEVCTTGRRLGMLRQAVELDGYPRGANKASAALSAADYDAVLKLILHGGSDYSQLCVAAGANFEPPDPEYFAKLCSGIEA